jgi:competence protein ComEA
MLWPRPSAPVVVATPRPTASPSPLVAVHVVGAVAQPGLYTLPADRRVADAVAQAGGFVDDADPTSLNLAARLVDGQQVVVRARAQPTAERAQVASDSRPASKLNLNQASAAELDALPGVGQALAQRILERRQRLGPFTAIEQLRDERILPSATFERVKDLVTLQ